MTLKIKKDPYLQALKDIYHDATRNGGLIDFTDKVRSNGKYSLNSEDLNNLFSTHVWEEFNKGGHRKLKNRVTDVVIEYSNHDNKGGIDPGAAETILNQVQKHLNTFCNLIFAYKTNHWKHEPDYQASLLRLKQFLK